MLTVSTRKKWLLTGGFGGSSIDTTVCLWQVYCMYGTVNREPSAFITGKQTHERMLSLTKLEPAFHLFITYNYETITWLQIFLIEFIELDEGN